jgi:hypothetical protein
VAMEDGVEQASGVEVGGSTRGRGGGWRALIADVRGEGDPLLAVLDVDATDPAGALAARWPPSVLDEVWRQAHLLGPSRAGDTVRQVS